MLDIKRIKQNVEEIKILMDMRGEADFSLDEVIELDDRRIALLQKVEVLKNESNTNSKKIPQYKKEGKGTAELMASSKSFLMKSAHWMHRSRKWSLPCVKK